MAALPRQVESLVSEPVSYTHLDVYKRQVIVGPKAGTIGKLSFGNNQLDKLKKTKLSGGSFNEIWVAGFGPVKLGELLADGYAYQNERCV